MGRLAPRLFDLVCRHNLVYNQCWEDPALDHLALALTPQDRVLAITSAGCNVLDYALTGARVVAVDANPRQTFLLELKQAGLRTLAFEEFVDLFGAGGTPRAPELYGRMRPALTPEARRHWDRHIPLFVPAIARGGSFYYCGTSGLFAYAVRRYLEKVAGLREALGRLLKAASLPEQVTLYENEIRGRLLHPAVLRLMRTDGVLALLGVPKSQRRLVEAHPAGLGGFLRDSLDRVVALGLLRENYFWSVYLTGRYTAAACPAYLSRAGFTALQGGLVENVQPVTATISDWLRRDEEPFGAFVLLDHMDWLTSRPDLLAEEWALTFARSPRGARAIFRSGGPDARFLPPAVAERLVFDTTRAAELHRRDRVGTYGSFHIARWDC